MRNVTTRRGNLEQMCDSLGLAATVQPADNADAENVRKFKYWCGRNLETARRELLQTQKLQRAELKPIEGIQEFIAAKEKAALLYCKRNEKDEPIYGQDADGRMGIEIVPEARDKYRAALEQVGKQFAPVMKQAEVNQRKADQVLEQNVTLAMFTVPFATAPEKMAGGLLADLRFMLEFAPAEPYPNALYAVPMRYVGSQAPDAVAWYQRWYKNLKNMLDGR